MKFSEWIEKRVVEVMDPELNRLKRDERLLLMSIEGRKDPMGRVLGANLAGYITAVKDLKELRAKIKALESKLAKEDGKAEIRPLPSWLQGRKIV